jgi:Rod binding domain-containing protein
VTIPPIQLLSAAPTAAMHDFQSGRTEDAAKAPEQFESILLRQFLSESMKPLLQEGPAGQVYGYLLTDSLAGSIASAGGLGLSSILQAQLGTAEPVAPLAD